MIHHYSLLQLDGVIPSMILRLDLELFQVFPFYWSYYYFTYVICDSSSGMDICSLRLKHRHHSVYFLKIAGSNPCLALLRHIKLTRKDMDVNKRERLSNFTLKP
jgi:hypothetical protein